jgi:hypothetical protein
MSYDMLCRQKRLQYRDVMGHAMSTQEAMISIVQLA